MKDKKKTKKTAAKPKKTIAIKGMPPGDDNNIRYIFKTERGKRTLFSNI